MKGVPQNIEGGGETKGREIFFVAQYPYPDVWRPDPELPPAPLAGIATFILMGWPFAPGTLTGLTPMGTDPTTAAPPTS